MSKIFLGSNLADMDVGEPLLPVSKVRLNVDSETYYEAGDNSGTTVESTCPWASQAMADSVLAKLQGFRYKPFDGYNAFLDPAAEFGDGITVGGMYSVLATIGRNLDRQAAATVGAPGVDEVDDEYPYKTKQQRANERTLAKARSLISKTANEILLQVEGISGEVTKLSVTLDGVTVTDGSGTTLIKGSSIETDTLKVNAANIVGQLTVGQLSNEVATKDQIPIYTSELINNSGYQNASGVVSIVNGTVTADYIYALGVEASTVRGANIAVKGENGLTYGTIYAGTNTVGSTALEINGTYGVRLIGGGGAVQLESAYGTGLLLYSGYAQVSGGNLQPGYDARFSCGASGHRWSDVYAANATIQTSDLNKKHNVIYDLTMFDGFFDSLKPMSFVFNDATTGRTHHGLGAQDVEQNLIEHGFTSMDFAGFIKSPKVDENDQAVDGECDYALRYGEFIPMMIDQIQRLKTRVSKLEGTA